jgi:hypothetical protein
LPRKLSAFRPLLWSYAQFWENPFSGRTRRAICRQHKRRDRHRDVVAVRRLRKTIRSGSQKHSAPTEVITPRKKRTAGELPPLPLSFLFSKAMIIEPMTMPTTSGRKYWTLPPSEPGFPRCPLEARNTNAHVFRVSKRAQDECRDTCHTTP